LLGERKGPMRGDTTPRAADQPLFLVVLIRSAGGRGEVTLEREEGTGCKLRSVKLRPIFQQKGYFRESRKKEGGSGRAGGSCFEDRGEKGASLHHPREKEGGGEKFVEELTKLS